MTKQKKFKGRVRQRATKTGESYATARKHLDDQVTRRPSAAFLAAHKNLPPVAHSVAMLVETRKYDGPGLGGKEPGVDLASYSEGVVIAGSLDQYMERHIKVQTQVGLDRLHQALKQYEDEVAAHGVTWGNPNRTHPETTHKTSLAFFQTLKEIQRHGTTLGYGDPKTRTLGFVDETTGMTHCANLTAFKDTPKEDEEAIAQVMGKPYKDISRGLRTEEGRVKLFSNSPLAAYYVPSLLSEEETWDTLVKFLEEQLGATLQDFLKGRLGRPTSSGSVAEIDLLGTLWKLPDGGPLWPFDESWVTLND